MESASNKHENRILQVGINRNLSFLFDFEAKKKFKKKINDNIFFQEGKNNCCVSKN